jgi:hypothetical protein
LFARLPGENQKLGGAVADQFIAHLCLLAARHLAKRLAEE